ncbi:hypothetical protein AGMMS50222_11050 [Endomicrobiia bacterium]|nr:hypothetical protein AGMMS49531_03550 [Endomicrobiia bacterium]GHT68381.1 hypothetical protein AGMMS49556_10100 [Endomicrobiia bacterium]GHT77574.1 hypothetical protein AGMMS50222_11050 [Endomicrobiia bacterium]
MVRPKRFKIVSKIDLGGLRQNTYKHTNPQKEIKQTLKVTKEYKELSREISSYDYSKNH